MTIEHNSARCCFRNPLGAVKTGGSVVLRLCAEGPDVRSVRVKTFFYGESAEYPMTRTNTLWEKRLSVPESPGVLWYFFIIETAQETLYFGPPMGRTQGEGVIYHQPPASFQMTVYDKNFDTPAWFRGKTMYQIFPDRFKRGNPENLTRGAAYHRAMGRTVVLHKNWDEPVLYEPVNGAMFYAPCDFYGGDLRGIIDSIPYFVSLGVGVLYLNPISEAASNHRYDTANYKNVDPILGTPEEFRELCEKAQKAGIRVMIDGVYSHTGSDSLYFNKLGNYPSIGAYQSERSPYYPWYTFHGSRDSYQCWWGFDTLPEVNEQNPVWQNDIITGPYSVFSYWKRLGAMGIRLDVADELPDNVIELMRTAWKADNPDRVLLGEVWEDATTKESYGAKRQYALGRGLDTVMNYPFKNAALSFLQGHSTAEELANFLTSQRLNYPLPMYHALMNLLSSHDEPRAYTILSSGLTGEGMTREEEAALVLEEKQLKTGRARFKLAGVLQFVIPGTPSIYYGDEQGMQGLKDPFNRGPFVQNDPALAGFFADLSLLRKKSAALSRGDVSFAALDPDTVGILRYIADGKDAFGKPAEDEYVLTVVNRSDRAFSAVLDFSVFSDGLPPHDRFTLNNLHLQSASVILGDCTVCLRDGRHIVTAVGASNYGVMRLR